MKIERVEVLPSQKEIDYYYPKIEGFGYREKIIPTLNFGSIKSILREVNERYKNENNK